MKNFKSYGFWTALAGAVTILISALGKCFGFSVDNQLVTDIIMAIAGVLVVLGVVSMPKKDNNKTSEESQEKLNDERDSQESEKESADEENLTD